MAYSNRKPVLPKLGKPGTIRNLGLKIRVSTFVVFTCFGILLCRLWYLQVVLGNYFQKRSENNRVQTIYVPAPRGIIADRDGRVVANNRPSYDLQITREDIDDVKATLKLLAEILREPLSDIEARYAKALSQARRFEPVTLSRDLDRSTVAKLSANRFKLPGVSINVVPTRNYIFGSFASHVFGYLREINLAQLEAPEFTHYKVGDMVGQTGVEKTWEHYLQGKRGRKRVVVNALGSRVGQLSGDSESKGNTVQLTIDFDVQREAEKQLEKKSGAVVAMNPNTGEILALASAGSYNPNVFSGNLSQATWKDLSQGQKLSNRAIQGAYPPGSVFKVIMAVAGLAEGVISEHDSVHCPGYYYFARRRYGCWKKGGHGKVSLHKALVSSCDTYFYQLGQRLGIDQIHKYATLFGLGERTYINLPDERSGLIPSRQWKKSAFRDPRNQIWFPGETLSVAIGQGAVTVTPLQLARATALLVNGGKLVKPQVASAILSSDNEVLFERPEFQDAQQVAIPSNILSKVSHHLEGVVEEVGGTASLARMPKAWNIRVGGKTGTAQVADLKYHKKAKRFEDHAWFVGYAPANEPEIVVATLVENGGHGGSAAAPIVGNVLKTYFKKYHNLQEPQKNETKSK
jgi:penicillin-binding protein 2